MKILKRTEDSLIKILTNFIKIVVYLIFYVGLQDIQNHRLKQYFEKLQLNIWEMHKIK